MARLDGAVTFKQGRETILMSTSTVANVRFWPIMIAIFFGAFLSILGISTINVALTIFMNDFHAELSTVQWTLTGSCSRWARSRR